VIPLEGFGSMIATAINSVDQQAGWMSLVRHCSGTECRQGTNSTGGKVFTFQKQYLASEG
jgi:hypothetical protein